jgi:hypothetical protein
MRSIACLLITTPISCIHYNSRVTYCVAQCGCDKKACCCWSNRNCDYFLLYSLASYSVLGTGLGLGNGSLIW